MFRHPAPFLKSEKVNAPAAESGLGRSARSAGPWKGQPLQTVYEQRRKIVPALRADYQNTPTVLGSECYGINVSSSRQAVVQLVTMPEPFFEEIAGMKQGNLILPKGAGSLLVQPSACAAEQSSNTAAPQPGQPGCQVRPQPGDVLWGMSCCGIRNTCKSCE